MSAYILSPQLRMMDTNPNPFSEDLIALVGATIADQSLNSQCKYFHFPGLKFLMHIVNCCSTLHKQETLFKEHKK